MASLHRNLPFLSYGISAPTPDKALPVAVASNHPRGASSSSLSSSSLSPSSSSFNRCVETKIPAQRCRSSPRRGCLQIFADKTTSPSPSLLPSTPRFYFSRQLRTDSSYSRLQSLGQNTEPMIARTVPVQVAHELLNAGHRYLDVRTPEEFKSAHIDGAINIPYMYRAGSGMSKNHAFLSEMMAQFSKDDEIVVGCQSGKRSQMAAAELMAMGYTGVADMAGGYLAWVQSGLSTAS